MLGFYNGNEAVLIPQVIGGDLAYKSSEQQRTQSPIRSPSQAVKEPAGLSFFEAMVLCTVPFWPLMTARWPSPVTEISVIQTGSRSSRKDSIAILAEEVEVKWVNEIFSGRSCFRRATT